MTTPAYLRPEQAALFLGVSVRCLRDWQRKGVLPYSKPARKVCLFAVADLQRAMQRFRIAAIGEGGKA